MKSLNSCRPKINFNRKLFLDLLSESENNGMTKDEIDEMAIPSYLHSNPFVRWIVFKRLKCIIELCNIQGGNPSLLDYGCGTGILNLQWDEYAIKYTGVDLMTWPADFILSHSGRKHYSILNAENWNKEIPDSSQDIIVCLEVLEHLRCDELEILLTQFFRKLTSAGYFIVSGPMESSFYRVMRQVAGFSGIYHQNNILNIKEMITSHNFKQDKIIQLPIPGFLTLFQIIKYQK